MLAVYLLLGLLGVLVFVFFGLGLRSQRGTARGLEGGKLSALLSKPNGVSSENGTAGKFKVDVFPVKWDALKAAIIAHGGKITRDGGDYFAAEFTSKHFKFVDDVEARLDGEQIHIRSASRVGYSDRGVNRSRVEALRAAL